jgi:hypothetical protein
MQQWLQASAAPAGQPGCIILAQHVLCHGHYCAMCGAGWCTPAPGAKALPYAPPSPLPSCLIAFHGAPHFHPSLMSTSPSPMHTQDNPPAPPPLPSPPGLPQPLANAHPDPPTPPAPGSPSQPHSLLRRAVWRAPRRHVPWCSPARRHGPGPLPHHVPLLLPSIGVLLLCGQEVVVQEEVKGAGAQGAQLAQDDVLGHALAGEGGRGGGKRAGEVGGLEAFEVACRFGGCMVQGR